MIGFCYWCFICFYFTFWLFFFRLDISTVFIFFYFSFSNKSALIRAWCKTQLKGQKLQGKVEAKGNKRKKKIDFGFRPNWIRALKDIKFNMADRSWEALKLFHFITSFAYCFFSFNHFVSLLLCIYFRNKRS